MVLPSLRITFFFIFLSHLCFGQISISYPTERIVFQRDNDNKANITIAGYFSGCIDRIEARFVPRTSGQGVEAPVGGGWTTIQENPRSGNYYGAMEVTGGWYRLEVRAILDNAETSSSTINRVGVGEVFVVAGQSNATGGDNNANGPAAADDRVNSVDFQNVNTNNSPVIQPYSSLQLPCPEFVHLDALTKTAPFGNYAWCWGSFGDKLVEKLNVPVMIFNAGWSSTGIRNWKESIPVNGNTTSDFSFQFPAGMPFGHLRITLNNYLAQLGVRAVLWHQGETDNLVSRSREAYLSDIREVIQATRDLSGKQNLAWVVARASRYTVNSASRTWQPVIDAQNDVIGLGSNGADPNYKMASVFPGPETDAYFDETYRSDQVHFAGQGLLSLADWWVEKLDNSFFSNATPYAATPPPHVQVSTPQNNDVTFTGPSGWNQYQWMNSGNCNSSIATTQTWTANSGNYQLKVTDILNNVVFSPKVQVPAAMTPSMLAGENQSAQQEISNGTNTLLATDCKIVSLLTPETNASAISQTVTGKVYIDATVQSYSSIPYLQRHYDFQLSNGNTALSSSMTLFFTQSEFNSFNAASNIDLPQDANDATGKSNLRIIQFQGTSSDNTANPSTYTGSRSEIVPSSVAWNTTFNSWAVTFNTTSTGGFFVGTTSTPLPVTLKYFRGKVAGSAAELEWETSSETNSAYFEIERSADAISFERIATKSAAGTTRTSQYYTYSDLLKTSGVYYYRLKQVDLDGTSTHSRIISLNISGKDDLLLFPNPVSDNLTIQSESGLDTIEIYNMIGIKVASYHPKASQTTIDLSKFTTGLYLIKANNHFYKIVKK